jgi:hypothetical protein
MTNTPIEAKASELLAVEQRHRDAAADLHLLQECGDQTPSPFDEACARAIRDGLNDHWDIVQAFARFERDHMAASPNLEGAEKRARELLAAEVEKMNRPITAAQIRTGPNADYMEAAAIRAITAALHTKVEDSRG